MGDYGWARMTFGGPIASATLDHLLREYADSGLNELEMHGGLAALEGDDRLGATFQGLEEACVSHGIQFSRRGELKYDGVFVAFWRWGMPELFSSEGIDDDPVIILPRLRAQLRALSAGGPTLAFRRRTFDEILTWLDDVSPEQTPLPPVQWLDDAIDTVVTSGGRARTTDGTTLELAGDVLARIGHDGSVALCALDRSTPRLRAPGTLAFEPLAWMDPDVTRAIVDAGCDIAEDPAAIQAIALRFATA